MRCGGLVKKDGRHAGLAGNDDGDHNWLWLCFDLI